jgi:hypothetical protein
VRRGSFALILAGLLILGGFLTLQIIVNGPNGALPGLRIQTLNEEASTMAIGEGQAVAFVLFCLVALASLVGGGFVLALILRFLDHQITEVRQE